MSVEKDEYLSLYLGSTNRQKQLVKDHILSCHRLASEMRVKEGNYLRLKESAVEHAAEVIVQAAKILRLLVLTIPLTTGFQAGIGALKTGSDVNYSLAINLISPNFIRVPIAFVLVKYAGLGFMGLYIGCVVDYIVRAAVVIWRICVMFSKKNMNRCDE